ncbi:hypothetical protein CH64_2075 [Yersinia rohdei]|uniref:Uncharacterized protein n=1 Tax=Yersinia rohdei TaxID=29485 RepID=A0ABN4F339_YERRO|nr:hypothetical protein CH64_2075 [Yersinia rohdei]
MYSHRPSTDGFSLKEIIMKPMFRTLLVQNAADSSQSADLRHGAGGALQPGITCCGKQ